MIMWSATLHFDTYWTWYIKYSRPHSSTYSGGKQESPSLYGKKKSKEIRVSADFSTGLYAALKDYHYPFPSPEEIFAKLNEGIFFDFSDVYLQIRVEEECSNLLCINTHRRLYNFGRLPLGVKVAPAIFQ